MVAEVVRTAFIASQHAGRRWSRGRSTLTLTLTGARP